MNETLEKMLNDLKEEAINNQKSENNPVFENIEDMFATGFFGKCIYSED